MKFFDQLQISTESERRHLLAAPLIDQSVKGEVDVELYVAFLCQAYHHVKHTTPLLLAAGARMPADKEWLRATFAEYIEEELGHQE
jgi:hypothetical protein